MPPNAKNLIFEYDAMGNRIAKHVLNSSDVLEKSTYYILDAQGKRKHCFRPTKLDAKQTPSVSAGTMSVYERVVDNEEESVSFYQAEKHYLSRFFFGIYGSSRLGMYNDSISLLGSENATYSMALVEHQIGNRIYELSNHLGNVLTTISDKPMPYDDDADDETDWFLADIRTAQDYSPFGVTLSGRNFTINGGEKSRYGFNSMEGDNEVKGQGNSYDFGARFYDSRLGRFLSIDPKYNHFAELSPYNAFNSNPIVIADPTGESGIVTITEGKGDNPGVITIKMNVFIYGDGANSKLANDSEKFINGLVNESAMKYMVNGKEYNVQLELNVTAISEAEACERRGPNKDYANNFIRVEDFNKHQKESIDAETNPWIKKAYGGKQGYVSQMTRITQQNGTNSGMFNSSSFSNDFGELLHELLHGMGMQHDDVKKYASTLDVVPASLPNGTAAKDYPKITSVIPNATKGSVIDEKQRILSTVDLNIVFERNGYKLNEAQNGITGVKFTNGKAELNMGSIDNSFYNVNGNRVGCENSKILNTEINEKK